MNASTQLQTANRKMSDSERIAKLEAEVLNLKATIDVMRGLRSAADGRGRIEETRTIEQAVCAHYGVAVHSLRSRMRTANTAWARQVCYWLLRTILEITHTRIAGMFRRDHSTVIYGVSAVEERMAVEPKTKAELEALAKSVLQALGRKAAA